jgi:hypothetical protein
MALLLWHPPVGSVRPRQVINKAVQYSISNNMSVVLLLYQVNRVMYGQHGRETQKATGYSSSMLRSSSYRTLNKRRSSLRCTRMHACDQSGHQKRRCNRADKPVLREQADLGTVL